MPPSAQPPEQRFWTKVALGATDDDCWLWLGWCNNRGYGMFYGGPSGQKNQLAHRASYELLVGPIPSAMEIDHLCRTRRCVNPRHLEPVTRQENCARARPTHCPQGHAYDEANTYVWTDGTRRCRACMRDRAAAKRQPVIV